nr:hypothetical protein [Tanacetum cinerariifolium]
KSQDKGKAIMIEELVKPKKKDQIRLDEEAELKLQKSQDKGKAIMIEELVKPKKKDQIRLDEEAALKLQVEFDKEEQILTRERAQKEQEKRRKFFAARAAEEKRNKPPTQAQQRKIMCTYLKNVEGKKLKDLKNKSFDSIQKMFDIAFNWQKMDDDKETTELKELMKIISDKEEVVIDAIPLVVKSPKIVD